MILLKDFTQFWYANEKSVLPLYQYFLNFITHNLSAFSLHLLHIPPTRKLYLLHLILLKKNKNKNRNIHAKQKHIEMLS